VQPPPWSAIKFAIAVGVLGSACGLFLDALIDTRSPGTAALVGLAAAIGAPLVTLFGVVVSAGLTHLFLRLLRARSRSFGATFDCACYAHAPRLFRVIPFIGGLVSTVWGMVVLTIGLKRVHGTTTGRALFSVLAGPVTLILLALGLRMFVIEAFKIPSGAMIPTLQVGDHIYVNKLAYRSHEPRRGDVIVFIYPKEPDKDFIKRVVAVGGDTIEIRDRVLYVNGAAVPREHVDADCHYDDFDESIGRWEGRACDAWEETLDGNRYTTIFDQAPRSWPARRVPPDSFFVMGDNRDNSHDSRFWGFVPRDLVKGKAMFIWWSQGPEGVRWERIGKAIR
jgi:signal peptidase I